MIFIFIKASYNAREHIANCIKPILEQSYLDFEQLIIDGYSDDNVLGVI